VEELAALAGALREMKELHFVVAGDGPRREWLATAIRRDGLPNVTLVPMVPAVEYPALVRRCDLFLSFLSPAIRYPVIPSKLGDGMAAGKPILAALPAGDARRLVEEAGAGLVVSPGDLPGLVAAASRLVESSAVRRHLGAGGRAYAVRRLDLGVVLSELACVLGG
jgi:colanic acid biosynthesis glycosyl transferase WcaI